MTPRLVRLCFVAAMSLAALAAFAQTPAAQPAPAAAEPAKPDDQMLEKLLLPDADIDTVIATLEMLTGRVVLRPNSLPTAGSYNLKITKPLPKSEAVLAIETVLALNNVGVAPQGDRFLVMTPLPQTRMSAPEMITGSTLDLPPSGKAATKIFQLDFLRVQEFAGLIQGILNVNYGGAVQLPNANALLITDSVSNLQRVETLLQQVDKPVMSGMKPKFYPLTSAKAADVVSKLRNILQGALQQQVGQATTYSADDRTNQIILVTDPRQYPFFDELIEKLDTKSNPNTRTEVISLKHADAQAVATLLTQLISGQTAASQRANAQALRPGQVNLPNAVTAPINPTVPNAPVVNTPNLNLSAPGTEGNVNEFSQLLTVIPDTRSNAVVVFGTGDDIRLITGIIDKLDVVLAQVRIEVVLAEVNLDDKHSSGISQLGLNVQGDKLVGFTATEASTTIGAGSSTGTATISPMQILKYADLSALITVNATPRLSNSAILSQPSITTTHNKKAIFFFGETRPVVTGTTSTPTAATTTSGFSTSSQVQQQQIGTKVTVQPLIGNDGTVAMDVNLDISDVTGNVQIDNNTQYIIGQRQVTSFNTAKSGEILVIGGIRKNSDSKSTTRLGPIPIIGDLLGGRSKEKNRQEVLIFIRPTVLTNTPDDNAPALNEVKSFPHKDDVMQQLDPKYQPEPKKLLDKILPK